MKFLIPILFSISAYSQGFKMDVKLHKVPVNSRDYSSPTTERVIVLANSTHFVLITNSDTLLLEYLKPKGTDYVYKEVGTNQKFYIKKQVNKDGFIIVICPLKPYIREKLYSFNISI